MKCTYPGAITTPHKVADVAPITKSQRTFLLQRIGHCSFLFPLGTPASPGKPSFPITTSIGDFSCSMGRAAYTRLGQAINRDISRSYRNALVTERKNLIRIAVKYASLTDNKNACNWALMAAEKYL
ncbi:MAG: hypothetical protein KAJ19_09975 [Gammaproteobacteria bacterium]|nr:hypothetical protein [Gammaproteobacteria bacterium]